MIDDRPRTSIHVMLESVYIDLIYDVHVLLHGRLAIRPRNCPKPRLK